MCGSVRDRHVSTVMDNPEVAWEMQDTNGDVELHRGFTRVLLVNVEPPCVEEADRDVAMSCVDHDPV